MRSSSSNHPSFLSPFFSFVVSVTLLLRISVYCSHSRPCTSGWERHHLKANEWTGKQLSPQLLLSPSWHCAECRQPCLAQQANGNCKHLVNAVCAACRNAQLTLPHHGSHPCHLSSSICICGATKETNGDQALPC